MTGRSLLISVRRTKCDKSTHRTLTVEKPADTVPNLQKKTFLLWKKMRLNAKILINRTQVNIEFSKNCKLKKGKLLIGSLYCLKCKISTDVTMH